MGQFSSPGIYLKEVPSPTSAIAGVGTSTAGFIGVMASTFGLPARDSKGEPTVVSFTVPTPVNKPMPITNWTEFVNAFGGLLGRVEDGVASLSDPKKPATRTGLAADAPALSEGHRNLAHAVLGFLNNGGTRCFVTYVDKVGDIQDGLDALGGIDEIALVCAPGVVDKDAREAIITHCELIKDRFAILDGPSFIADLGKLITPASGTGEMPRPTSYAAWYYPWLKVFDPAADLNGVEADPVPPSGHIAGIYARVDSERGFFKSPANEFIRGALGVSHPLSRVQQDSLNPKGVNLLRDVNGGIRVWGARTVGGDENSDMKYISLRRTLMFLSESINEGMQYAVFEPHTPALWARITRDVSAFLRGVWRSGALFGATEQEAFFVRCNGELNPAEQRANGELRAQVGVALVRPAEFVIFEISQFSGNG